MHSRVAGLPRSRAAWAVPAILAIVITGYLGWGAWESAHDPSWLYLDQEWWRVWLRPQDDGVLLVVSFLWLLASLTYWWPRRREPESVGLVIAAAMVAIGAFLGAASFAPCRGGQSRTAVVAWVLSLYFGNFEPRYGTPACPSMTLPLALQLGRAVCLGATLVGALAAAAVLWRQPVGRLRARLVKDATVLTGLDAMTLPLLRRLTSIGPENRVVVIEPDGRHPLLNEARATGAQIVVASPMSERVLMPLLRGLRGPQLRYLFALHPELADNEDVLGAAKAALSRIKADPDKPPHLIARIDDPTHADLWRGERIGASPLWFEDALSPQESTASALVHQIVSTGVRQVLLCGDSTLALAILLEFAHRAWECQGIKEAAAIGSALAADPASRRDEAAPPAAPWHAVEHVVLLDQRAEDLRREFRATSPQPIVAALPSVDAWEAAWRDQLLGCLDAMSPAEAAGTVVLIADSPSEANMHEAGRVARLHPRTQVFVLSSDGAGVTGVVFGLLQPFQRALLVAGEPPEDTWIRIARHWHECYRLSHPAVSGGARKLTRKPWAELDEFFREDNVLQLRSIMAAVTARGRRWAPSRTVAHGSFVELTDGDVLHVARQEHCRWYERRKAAGWRATAEGEEDDDSARINSVVRPWDDLPEETRKWLPGYLRSQLAQLEAVGFMPVLPECGPPGAADFLRIGEVRAERLITSHAWRHTSGGVLSGTAGDWRVIDEAGDERTVRDQEFHATHQPLDGDRWRRSGKVRAWRVSEATAVRTIEGRIEAQPGDWIVQGPRTVRWPVTAEQFARGYRELPVEPAE